MKGVFKNLLPNLEGLFWPSQQQGMGTLDHRGVSVSTLPLGKWNEVVHQPDPGASSSQATALLTKSEERIQSSNYRKVSKSPFSLRSPSQLTESHKATCGTELPCHPTELIYSSGEPRSRAQVLLSPEPYGTPCCDFPADRTLDSFSAVT